MTSLLDSAPPQNPPRRRRGRGEGHVRQMPDGRWVAQLDLGYIAGKRKRPAFYGKTKSEALRKAREARAEHERGLPVTPERKTVAQYLTEWLAATEPTVRPKTYVGYESIVRTRIVPHLGRRKLGRLTALDVQKLYADLEAAGLSKRSIHHTHRVLKRALRQAVRWNLIGRNPCDGATPPRPDRSEMHPLTQEQVSTLLEATREHPDHALYVLAVTTGMRQGELLGLAWSDVDLDAGHLRVRRALQRQRGKGLVFTEPKTARSRRTIHLSRAAVAALREHRRQQNAERLRLGPAWQDHDLVFPRADGTPRCPTQTTKAFQRALTAAGLPRVRFHDLRHTAATLLLSAGTHPKVVSEMLGHATITLTLDTYSHLLPTMHEQAAAAMDRMLGS